MLIFQRAEEIGETLHPLLELFMLAAAWEDAADGVGILVVPRRATR